MERHVIVCGFGQVGYHVTRLLQALGESVVVITVGGRADWVSNVKEAGADVIFGDARSPETIRSADLSSAKAVLACTSNESVNLEIGLDVRRVAPTIPVIVRLFDNLLAEKLDELFGMRAFTTATIAGSAFAAAAFGENVVAEFGLGSDKLLVIKIEASEVWIGKTLGDLSTEHGFPILLHMSQNETRFTPDPATVILEGDIIQVIGHAKEFKRLRLDAHQDSLYRRLVTFFRPVNPLRFVFAVWRDTSTEVRASFLAVTAVAMASCFAFAIAFDLSPLNAVYFVVSTMTTVGYGDITPQAGPVWNPHAGTPWAVALGCVLMVNGVIWMVLMYVIVTNYLVSARLEQASNRGGPDGGHTIVVGVGDVGLRTTEELVDARLPVVVIDARGDSTTFKTALRKSPGVIGDARDAEVLNRARVRSADAIVVTTDDDAVNLSVGVAAKAINPKIRVVLRIAEAQFATKLSESHHLSRLISAPARSAPAFVGAVIFPGAITSFVHNGHLISLLTESIPDGPTVTVEDQTLSISSTPLAHPEQATSYEA